MLLNPNSHVPMFEQIANSIRTGIAAGIYRPGDMLPSLRSLALELTVNPNTVQKAYDQLEREGLVDTRKGIGLFVARRGRGLARTKAHSLVNELLSDGVAAGRAAGLRDDDIRALFERVLELRPSGVK